MSVINTAKAYSILDCIIRTVRKQAYSEVWKPRGRATIATLEAEGITWNKTSGW